MFNVGERVILTRQAYDSSDNLEIGAEGTVLKVSAAISLFAPQRAGVAYKGLAYLVEWEDCKIRDTWWVAPCCIESENLNLENE